MYIWVLHAINKAEQQHTQVYACFCQCLCFMGGLRADAWMTFGALDSHYRASSALGAVSLQVPMMRARSDSLALALSHSRPARAWTCTTTSVLTSCFHWQVHPRRQRAQRASASYCRTASTANTANTVTSSPSRPLLACSQVFVSEVAREPLSWIRVVRTAKAEN